MAAEFQKYIFNYETDLGGTVPIPVRIKNGSPYVPPGYQPRATNALPCGSDFNFRPRRLVAKRIDANGQPEQFSYVVNKSQIRDAVLALVNAGFQCVDLVGEEWPNAFLELSATVN